MYKALLSLAFFCPCITLTLQAQDLSLFSAGEILHTNQGGHQIEMSVGEMITIHSTLDNKTISFGFYQSTRSDNSTSVLTQKPLGDVSIFPNPTSGGFTIRNFEKDRKMNCKIYDISGNFVKQVAITDMDTQVVLQDEPAGKYILQFLNEEEISFSRNLIKTSN